MKLLSALFGVSLSCLTLFPLPAIAQEAGDQSFLAVRDAARAGDLKRLAEARRNLGPHVLTDYADYYRLNILLIRDDPEGIPAFLARHDGSYLAERLRGEWVRWLGKRGDWNAVAEQFPQLAAPDVDSRCYAQQARWARGEQQVIDEIAGLWLTLLEPGEACQPVLELLVNSSRVDTDAIWLRARHQIEANRLARAQQTWRYLPAGQAPDARQADNAHKNAMAYLARQNDSWHERRGERELTLLALARLASNDPLIAARELAQRQARLTASEAQWAWGQIALHGARKHLPQALDWYGRAGATPLSEENQQWRVRAALRNQDWSSVRRSIESMSPELAERPEWIYWLGRALQAQGQPQEAGTLFARIAGQANFYGNLADEELGRQVMPPPRASAPTADEQRAAAEHPGLRRALALFRTDMRVDGVREWNWSLRGMSDRELLAAAELARRHEIWDRAINTADRTRNEHDYTLRFLAPFADQIRPVAREQTLDDAWVYGLMRQESRFITNARSHVGASGLMQLMPATASWVAKKIGLRDFHPKRVNDTEVNVLLGTSYMRLVMENLDQHPVLASAAYNAGPGRAKRWRAERPLEGAIYAETIPFSETRDYVKKVMSNAMYYSALFNGKPDSLKARLGTIGPRASQAMRDEDLP